MPLVDIEARRAYGRAQYVKNRSCYIARSKARRLRIQHANKEKRVAEALLPKPEILKFCIGCNMDITHTYKPKRGHRCAMCSAA
jgi:hypothetical protein